MTHERRAIYGTSKTGGQRSPQVTTNPRTADSNQSKQTVEKRRDMFKTRVVSMRIENDLYERQSS